MAQLLCVVVAIEDLYVEFRSLLDQEKKEECVDWALAKVANNEIEVVQLYTDILTRTLNNITCEDEDKWACVWREHVKTGIVRTIIECCYPYVKTARDLRCGETRKGKALVLCPKEEYHELGARVVADFFT
ncbi:MAG TPA: hypothetical protein VKK79_06850, partial [Candidatus Lokiarchaeia archaeon]|nr:hypothetical protein [Candidatus Lokiarchaeia archaeon]